MRKWLLDSIGRNPENKDPNLDVLPKVIHFTPPNFLLITSTFQIANECNCFLNHHFSFYTPVINLFYSRDHRSKSLQGVGPHPGLQVILPGQQWVCDEMGEAALFLQGADTRFQAMLGGNANLAILNLGFFFPEKLTIQSYTWN